MDWLPSFQKFEIFYFGVLLKPMEYASLGSAVRFIIYKGYGYGFEHTKFLSGPVHSFIGRMYRHPDRRFGLARKPLYKNRPHPHAGVAMFYSTDRATREPAISSMTAGAVRKGAGRWMLSVRP